MASSTGKRGLCWGSKVKGDLSLFTSESGSKVTWLHNWSTEPHLEGTGKLVEWVPLQWNAEDIDKLADLVKNPPSPPSGGDGDDDDDKKPESSLPAAKAVLGFSEPESENGANMTPEVAATAWLKYIEPLRKEGIRAGSPGMTAGEEGFTWMGKFIKLIRDGGGDVDFWALHWYGPADLGLLYNFFWSAHARLGNDKPVWITEYACTSWNADEPIAKEAVEDFCKQSITYMDTLDWIERYAWNGPTTDPGALGKYAALLDKDGALSDLGKIYRDS